MKKYEIEISRHNVTPAQFLAYVRAQLKKKGLWDLTGDLDLDYFRRGNDLNFYYHDDPEKPCKAEKSVSRPYEMQTYVLNWNGTCYNEICEFEFDDEKTGHGYYYLLNTVEEETAEETTEEAAENKEDNTMKNTFEAIYQQIEALKARFQTAKAANDAEGMEQVRAEHMALGKDIEAKGATFAWMYDFYEDARQRGNEHIDISECYDYRDEAALIASFRECGIDTFTFSSSWSSAVESAWKFTQNGCTLMGMVEINSKTKTCDGDGYEKRHAYLFKVN